MGDSIYTLPAVKRLVNYYKDRIVLITFPENISIYTLLFPEIKYAAIGMKEFMFSGRISGRSPRKKTERDKT
ncbi:MAG: hypothetical protein EHM47_17555 [Ignavibacteriales bacterium]|nr:MAG: hypothetical protein EHM47_17555 [Ignavibacteriales bacterium]